MLEQFLVTETFLFMLVFSRIGSAMMLMPGIGDVYVPARIRLFFSLMISLLMVPVMTPIAPPVPTHPVGLMLVIAGEVFVGVFFGSMARIILSSVHTAGTTIALQSGLGASMMLDITQTSQSTPLTNLLSITAITLIFATDLHHVLIMAVAQSYDIFQPGGVPAFGDTAYFAAKLVTKSFAVAAQMAAPHIVVGTVTYLSAGILARLMPQLQVFFILLAPQMLFNFFILMVTLSGIMMWYMGYLESSFMNFLSVK